MCRVGGGVVVVWVLLCCCVGGGCCCVGGGCCCVGGGCCCVGGGCCCVGGVCFCVFVLFCFFGGFSSFSFLLSLFPSSLSFFLLSSFPLLSSLSCLPFHFLFSLLFSPPNTVERTDQPTRRPTSRHLNVIWRTAGAQQSVLSLLLSLSSSKKRIGTLNDRNISGEEFILYYSLKLTPKNSFILIRKQSNCNA